MYELRSVHKRYGLAKVALRKIDLAVRDREFLVVYGPAGAGKSTLLNILAGISKPTSGDVLRNGASILRVPPEKRDAAMAFENYALYSHLSVGENLAFPLKARFRPRRDRGAGQADFRDSRHRPPARAAAGLPFRRAAAARRARPCDHPAGRHLSSR
nr:ATP-binding cassette domain-containing protein [Sinorhizobium meliloti]